MGSNKRQRITPATVEDSEDDDVAAGGVVSAVPAAAPAARMEFHTQLGSMPGMSMFAARANQVLAEASEARTTRARQAEEDEGASSSS